MKSSVLCSVALVSLAACDLDVGDLNNLDIDELLERPTPPLVASTATGLLIGHRADMAAANGYVSMLGILGRESYNFDAADARFVSEMLAAEQLDPGSPRFGGNFWLVPYQNIRNANLLFEALDKVQELSAEEIAATKGFARTFQALDLLTLINTRDVFGVPVDVGIDIDALAPFLCKPVVFERIATLLDDAAAELSSGGDEFPFPLSSGFAGFDSPATFLTFNRAIKARVEVYRGADDASRYDEALAALAESFLVDDPNNLQLELGVYHVFGQGAGDLLNDLVNPNLFVHPSVPADAECFEGVTDCQDTREQIDLRVAAKLRNVTARTYQGLNSDLAFTMYESVTAPLPVVRNEELILLRAEANIGIGGAAALSAAIDDINLIRTAAAGLSPRTDLDATNILDELLHQKRYSLLFEGGHRWIDMRRYGRLDQLPRDNPTIGDEVIEHTVHEAFPVPVNEVSARDGNTTCITP